MANSTDPDKTDPPGAVWSGSALFAYAISLETLVCEILGHLQLSEISIFEVQNPIYSLIKGYCKI